MTVWTQCNLQDNRFFLARKTVTIIFCAPLPLTGDILLLLINLRVLEKTGNYGTVVIQQN